VLNSPRTYHVRASSEEDIGRWGQREDLAHLHIESEFDLTLRVPREGELEAAYQPFFNDLDNGPDFEIRYFAATAIAQHPPLFVESVLTKIVDSPGTTIANIVDASIVGLGRLETPSARAKLIAMASTGPDEFRQPAIQALGELGNPSDCQVLLFIANQNKDYTRGEAYMYAGRVCKERAIPALSRLLPTADPLLSGYVAAAFENTLSRDAISPLIGLLASPDEGVRRDAEESLETLTHQKSQYGIASAESSNKSRMEWTGWWEANGRTAPIYGPDQCADPQPLH
jgi:HEAT repeat protein